jgi:hypothetical protein
LIFEGIYPADAKEAARAEMIKDGCLDFLAKYFAASLYGTMKPDDFKTKEAPKWLGFFNKLLEHNDGGKGVVVGKEVRSIGDLLEIVLEILSQHCRRLLQEPSTMLR